jgi:hypothetical protein
MGIFSKQYCPKHPGMERGFCSACSHGKRGSSSNPDRIPEGTFKATRGGLKRKS